jgi:hypothetical protein|tara:strand:- start:672 stop:1397 length:726 start_codon:yes stop_codon:yes gene_type:complete
MSQTAQKILNRFWEFLMLFIAITLGFFVENYRESLSDKEQEKEIIVSFINDIEEDIKELDIVIERREIRETRIDSILYILNNDLQDNFGRNLYYYARYLPRPFVFWANNTTNEELKYSGNFILIKNQKIIDVLLEYDDNYVFIDFIRQREEYLVRRLFDQINVIFDPKVFDEMNVYDIEFVYPSGNPKINSKNREVINNFLSNLHYVKTVNVGQLGLFKKHQKRGKEILELLKKEYPNIDK